MKKLKIIVILSLTLNLVFLLVSGAFAYKKGMSYLFAKAESAFTTKSDFDFDAYYQQRKTLFESLPNSEGDVVFLGDSITNGAEWGELFQSERVINRGIGGDTTEGASYRLDNITKNKPAKLFIMIGANDLDLGDNVSKITSNYKNILEKIHKESPNTKIFIQSLLPINDTILKSNRTNKDIVSLNTNLQKLATEYNCTYIDLFSLFTSSDGKLDKKYTNDGLHLIGDGYLVWKSAIEKYVK